MKKLRITVEGKAYDVTVEVLDEGAILAAPAPAAAPAPVSAPAPAPAPSAAPAAAPRPEPPASQSPSAPVAPAGDGKTGEADVTSPLAGVISQIDVSVGQKVAEGDQLLLLEAMKMHNAVLAPRNGTVEAILVEAGASVAEGQDLLVLS